MAVEHWNTGSDGPPTEAAMRRKLESRGYAVTRYVYPPGTYFPPHTHDVDKIDAVVCGRLRITLAGKSHKLEAGDMLPVSRGAVHKAAVDGDDEVVSLDAVRIR